MTTDPKFLAYFFVGVTGSMQDIGSPGSSRSGGNVSTLLLSHLLLSHFLTFEAVACPRNCFEPLRFNFVPAFGAFAKSSLPNAFESLRQIGDKLSRSGGFECQVLPFKFRSRFIGAVSIFYGSCSSVLLHRLDSSFGFCNAALKYLPKWFEFLRSSHDCDLKERYIMTAIPTPRKGRHR